MTNFFYFLLNHFHVELVKVSMIFVKNFLVFLCFVVELLNQEFESDQPLQNYDADGYEWTHLKDVCHHLY